MFMLLLAQRWGCEARTMSPRTTSPEVKSVSNKLPNQALFVLQPPDSHTYKNPTKYLQSSWPRVANNTCSAALLKCLHAQMSQSNVFFLALSNTLTLSFQRFQKWHAFFFFFLLHTPWRCWDAKLCISIVSAQLRVRRMPLRSAWQSSPVHGDGLKKEHLVDVT